MGCHSGVTYLRIDQTLHWKGLKKRVTDFVAACPVCQQSKYLGSHPQGLLHPFSILEEVWEEVSMDFIVKLPKSNAFDSIMVVVDKLSKCGHFVPLKHPYSAHVLVVNCMKEVVRLHGIHVAIAGDLDSMFMSLFWKELFKLQGMVLKMSIAYHRASDGQMEVFNRILETYLRCFCSEHLKDGLISLDGLTIGIILLIKEPQGVLFLKLRIGEHFLH